MFLPASADTITKPEITNVIASLPMGVLTDSYKVTHPVLYPPELGFATAYGEFRWSFDRDCHDHRILFWGISSLVERFLARRWTLDEIGCSFAFYSTHFPPGTDLDYLHSLFQAMIDENDGWFPVRLWALPEGTTCYPHTPIYIIEAEGKWACLVTWLETILTHIWYPTTVATLSRRCRDLIEAAFEKSVCRMTNKHSTRDHDQWTQLLETRLHDFGFRGCTGVEQAVIGGTAHLLSFRGSDTAAAAYYAQYWLNEGRPVASSIPATEHSVMLAHSDERAALLRALACYGEGLVAVVLDSFDFDHALHKILPTIRAEKVGKGGFLVVRPDSGDPTMVILMALRALEEIFGATLNSKGYKVLQGCGVIHGDGISYQSINQILEAILAAGYSAENVVFGMGAGLLHRGVHRDTMGMATKLSQVAVTSDAKIEIRDVCKYPQHDLQKTSLPGRFKVYRQSGKGAGSLTVRSAGEISNEDEVDAMLLYYDHGPIPYPRESFAAIKARSLKEWNEAPLQHNPISIKLREKLQSLQAQRERN